MTQLTPTDLFSSRHIGPRPAELASMLARIGVQSVDALIDQTIPPSIRRDTPIGVAPAVSEVTLLAELRAMANLNTVATSWIGMGYYGTITPGVIQRTVFENPGWYTAYTPYQAEIAQGRLTALLNFQTLVCELTGLPVANASLLDEATAAAEAMTMLQRVGGAGHRFFVADDCFPQTIDVVRQRAEPLGIEITVGPIDRFVGGADFFGALIQYPNGFGEVRDYRAWVGTVQGNGTQLVVAADLLSLTLLVPPGEWGADIVIGSAQRFGVPMGFGGPHAAFLAAKESYKRQLPGRIIGQSVDRLGNPALRMALQTREQHIRREKATSNICTAQALLAIMASFYAVYHGPDGLMKIATRIHQLTAGLARIFTQAGYTVGGGFFDTIRVSNAPGLAELLATIGINVRRISDTDVGCSLDETTDLSDINRVAVLLGQPALTPSDLFPVLIPAALRRQSEFLTHPVFHRYRSETEMLRYIHQLEAKDLALNTAMIPLGSCTMKLNATAQMTALSWPEFANLHPFAPNHQTQGYQLLFDRLAAALCAVTELAGASLQPNSGAQGEYAGLLTIRAFQASQGQAHRDIALIPSSAHGTNPASAAMVGLTIVIVRCDANGNIDIDDLKEKATQYADRLSVLMVTYPSTHGVFESRIQDICGIIHEAGGQVYMDGANMNAQVGLTSPGRIGADVCHINLHKTFAIPHGGGGPGMGPICVAAHLVPFLPGHSVVGESRNPAVSAAPYGSASILLISYAYIRLLGPDGLKLSTEIAIVNANYIKARLESAYPVLYTGAGGRVAHELILNFQSFKKLAKIEVEDVAKRLMDYGFHAPTISFPVPGTVMIEPTESESLAELDRFCEAMLAIRDEIEAIVTGVADPIDNVLKNAPHIAAEAISDHWPHSYTRAQAVYPPGVRTDQKFWPAVARVDGAFGDRNLVCTCLPIEAYA